MIADECIEYFRAHSVLTYFSVFEVMFFIQTTTTIGLFVRSVYNHFLSTIWCYCGIKYPFRCIRYRSGASILYRHIIIVISHMATVMLHWPTDGSTLIHSHDIYFLSLIARNRNSCVHTLPISVYCILTPNKENWMKLLWK